MRMSKVRRLAHDTNAQSPARREGYLVETDLLLKTKPIEERLALDMLVAELTGAG